MSSQAPDLAGRAEKRQQQHAPPTPWAQPHSPEAERCVLGSILFAPAENTTDALSILSADAFFDPRHQLIFSAIAEMHKQNNAVDLMTLGQWMTDRGTLEQVGGASYLAQIGTAVPTPHHIHSYAKIVRDKFKMRQILESCSRVAAVVQESPDNPVEVLNAAQMEFLKSSADDLGDRVEPIKKLSGDFVVKLDEWITHKGEVRGVHSGFYDLDRVCGGFQGGQMIVFAARPGVGKTSFALNMAEYAAVEKNTGVLIFSLEMQNMEIMLRLVSSLSGVDSKKIKSGLVSDQDVRRIQVAVTKLSNAPLFFEDTGAISLPQLRTSARRIYKKHGIGLIVIDYLQIMTTGTISRDDNRQAQVAELSGGIKSLAKELDIPIIVLCQLNRESEKRDGRQPKLADLRESGAIEQDADMVGLLYRPDSQDGESGMNEVSEAVLDIAKNRSGETARIKLTFMKRLTKFLSYSSEQDGTSAGNADRGGSA